jgi:nuclear transport factor 2 (NTF2) superfamily protein
MRKRVMLGNDVPISEAERKFRWDRDDRAAEELAASEFAFTEASTGFY